MNYVFYHANCTDGFGAAFVAWMHLGDTAEYIPVNYGQIKTLSDVINLPQVAPEEDSFFYILDFSFPKPVMEDLFASAKMVTWLDHHKTAFEMYYLPVGQFEEVVDNRHVELDNDRSGAMLAWDYFEPFREAPDMIKYIDDHDRWQFKLDWSKEFHAGMAAHKPWTFEQWYDVYTDSMTLGAIITDGQTLLNALETRVKEKVDRAAKCTVDVYDVNGLVSTRNHGLVINSDNDISELGHELANKSGTFGLVWYMNAEGKINCSFRSNGDYDVSAIAKGFGGGGHRNAAGCQVDVGTLIGWMKC